MSHIELVKLALLPMALIGCPTFILWLADRWVEKPKNSHPHPAAPATHSCCQQRHKESA